PDLGGGMNVAVATAPSPTLDPITVEVIGAALSSIVEETGEALIRASYSTNIKERRDCSTALFDVQGRTLCQAEHIPIHLGSFIGIVPHVLKHHPITDMRPGDVFIGNDPYAGGGTHLPDIVMAEPIFVDGMIVAWTVNLAHHADFADRGHAHIYQEGLRIPPIRLYRAGELQQDVLDLVLLNCQVPRERLSDLRAQTAANRVGMQRLQALCSKYGVATVLAAGDALLDYAERKMRAGIAAIPDGIYRFTDVFENGEIEGELPISVEITVSGDAMKLHFVSPPQVRAGINMTYTALLATVYYAVKSVVDPTILPNAGLARPLTVTAAEGTVLNCVHPAAVNGRVQTCERVSDMIFGALARAVPERVMACTNSACSVATFVGQRPDDGTIWVYLETMGGGSGARPDKDGLDGVHVHITNTSNLPVEALEPEYPLVVESYALVPDSGGPGRWRGGLGICRQIRAEEHECHAFVHGARRLSAPWGLAGGHDGGTCRLVYSEGVEPPVRAQGFLKPGQSVTIITPGAGGYGDPSGRDPALVRRDVADGLVSEIVAREVYGLSEGE